MEPLEMVLIDAVLHHLQIVTVDQPRAQGSNPVFSHQHIVAGQERHRVGTEVGKDNPGKLLSLVSPLRNALLKAAVGRLARLLQHTPVNVVKPSVVATTQTAILDMAE